MTMTPLRSTAVIVLSTAIRAAAGVAAVETSNKPPSAHTVAAGVERRLEVKLDSIESKAESAETEAEGAKNEAEAAKNAAEEHGG